MGTTPSQGPTPSREEPAWHTACWALLPCMNRVALGWWNRELGWSQELQRGGARQAPKHLEPSTKSRSTVGRGLGTWPAHLQWWEAGPVEGCSRAQVPVLPVACFSIGILGAQSHPCPGLTSWASAPPPPPQPISAESTSLPAQTPPVPLRPGPSHCSVILRVCHS